MRRRSLRLERAVAPSSCPTDVICVPVTVTGRPDDVVSAVAPETIVYGGASMDQAVENSQGECGFVIDSLQLRRTGCCNSVTQSDWFSETART